MLVVELIEANVLAVRARGSCLSLVWFLLVLRPARSSHWDWRRRWSDHHVQFLAVTYRLRDTWSSWPIWPNLWSLRNEHIPRERERERNKHISKSTPIRSVSNINRIIRNIISTILEIFNFIKPETWSFLYELTNAHVYRHIQRNKQFSRNAYPIGIKM